MWGSMLGAAVGGGIGVLNSYMSNQWAKEREDEARAENYKYGEMQAENADARTRALYQDLQSPSAMLQQYKDAGLSPALMFGNGGGAGGSLASGAQGASAAVAPTTYGAQAMQGAELALMLAQVDKTKAETKNIQKGTEKTQAEIDNIVADTGNKELEARNIHVKNLLLQWEEAFASDTYNKRVEQITADYDKTIQEIALLLEETKKAETDAQIEKESAQHIIDYYKNRALDMSASFALKKSQKTLTEAQVNMTDEQAHKLFNDCLVDSANVYLRGKELQVDKDKLKAQIEQWAMQNGFTEKGQKIAIANMVLNFISDSNSNFLKGLSTIASFGK